MIDGYVSPSHIRNENFGKRDLCFLLVISKLLLGLKWNFPVWTCIFYHLDCSVTSVYINRSFVFLWRSTSYSMSSFLLESFRKQARRCVHILWFFFLCYFWTVGWKFFCLFPNFFFFRCLFFHLSFSCSCVLFVFFYRRWSKLRFRWLFGRPWTVDHSLCPAPEWSLLFLVLLCGRQTFVPLYLIQMCLWWILVLWLPVMYTLP